MTEVIKENKRLSEKFKDLIKRKKKEKVSYEPSKELKEIEESFRKFGTIGISTEMAINEWKKCFILSMKNKL